MNRYSSLLHELVESLGSLVIIRNPFPESPTFLTDNHLEYHNPYVPANNEICNYLMNSAHPGLHEAASQYAKLWAFMVRTGEMLGQTAELMQAQNYFEAENKLTWLHAHCLCLNPFESPKCTPPNGYLKYVQHAATLKRFSSLRTWTYAWSKKTAVAHLPLYGPASPCTASVRQHSEHMQTLMCVSLKFVDICKPGSIPFPTTSVILEYFPLEWNSYTLGRAAIRWLEKVSSKRVPTFDIPMLPLVHRWLVESWTDAMELIVSWDAWLFQQKLVPVFTIGPVFNPTASEIRDHHAILVKATGLHKTNTLLTQENTHLQLELRQATEAVKQTKQMQQTTSVALKTKRELALCSNTLQHTQTQLADLQKEYQQLLSESSTQKELTQELLTQAKSFSFKAAQAGVQSTELEKALERQEKYNKKAKNKILDFESHTNDLECAIIELAHRLHSHDGLSISHARYTITRDAVWAMALRNELIDEAVKRRPSARVSHSLDAERQYQARDADFGRSISRIPEEMQQGSPSPIRQSRKPSGFRDPGLDQYTHRPRGPHPVSRSSKSSPNRQPSGRWPQAPVYNPVGPSRPQSHLPIPRSTRTRPQSGQSNTDHQYRYGPTLSSRVKNDQDRKEKQEPLYSSPPRVKPERVGPQKQRRNSPQRPRTPSSSRSESPPRASRQKDPPRTQSSRTRDSYPQGSTPTRSHAQENTRRVTSRSDSRPPARNEYKN